jgi:hypothetical protein
MIEEITAEIGTPEYTALLDKLGEDINQWRLRRIKESARHIKVKEFKRKHRGHIKRI